MKCELSETEVQIILDAIEGPSVSDPDTARLYERLHALQNIRKLRESGMSLRVIAAAVDLSHEQVRRLSS